MGNPVNHAEETADTFAQRLKQTRKRQELKQSELAEKSGLTPAAISQLESGQREPSFSTIVRLARALRTSPNDLMGIGDDEQVDPSLRGLFREVKDLDKEAVDAVRAFVNYLAQKAKE